MDFEKAFDRVKLTKLFEVHVELHKDVYYLLFLLDLCRNDDDRCDENVEERVIVGGELLKDFKFADDQEMVAQTENGLQNHNAPAEQGRQKVL